VQENKIESLALKEKVNAIEHAIKPIRFYGESIQTLNKTIKEKNDQIDFNSEQIVQNDLISARLFTTAEEKIDAISEKLNKAIQKINLMQEKMNYITSEMRNKTEHHDFLFDQTVKFLKNHIVRRLDFLESVIRNTAHVCDVPRVRDASNNSSGTIRYNEKVVYKCNKGYYTSDQLVRTCGRNGLEPSLTDKPIECIFVSW